MTEAISEQDEVFESLDVRLERGSLEIDEVIEIARMLAVHLDALHENAEIDGAIVPSRIEIRKGGAPRLAEAAARHQHQKAYLAPEAWDQTRALIARGGPEADAAKELLRVMDARHTAREETMTILEQLKPERGAHVPSKLLFPESLEDLGASDVATWLEARGAA